MVKICAVFCILTGMVLNVYPEDIRTTDSSTVITRSMVSPSKNAEAAAAYNKANEFMRNNNFDEAEKYFLIALELDPEFVDAMDHLGFVYRNQKRYEDAEKMYLKSIAINQSNTAPYINLAIVYRYQGRLEDAKQIYLKTIEIDKDEPEAYYGIGALYHLVKQYETSINFINIAIQKYYEKDSPLLMCQAYYFQGYNYYNLNNYEEALKCYKVALLGYPDDEKLNDLIAEIEIILNKKSAASSNEFVYNP
jgi:tetratricopeptide (TPR) repeat protein